VRGNENKNCNKQAILAFIDSRAIFTTIHYFFYQNQKPSHTTPLIEKVGKDL
jgi:hypothetical protein